jgi:predicted RecB family nuclease
MPKTTKSGGVSLASPVTVLSGVGPAKAAAYAKAGIETLEDLIVAAMNEAIGKVEKISAEEMQKITGSIGGLGMGMPGLF